MLASAAATRTSSKTPASPSTRGAASVPADAYVNTGQRYPRAEEATSPSPSGGGVLRSRVARVGALIALFSILAATTIPGVFTIDEPNYLATLISLRHGRLSLPDTEGLPPSQELAYFDPSSRGHGVTTPIVSYAPPLWAVIALPFSWLGLRGLFAMNTLAYLAAALLVFRYASRHAREPQTPWVASGVFLLATYTLEYAQAIWPHMLALALCLAAFYLASRVRQGAPLGWAVAAGLLAGTAAGVRYQDFFFAGLVGLTLLVLGGRRRIAAALAYGCGVALPLATSSILNHLRFGSWNPISKGPRYFKMTAGAAADEPLFDTLAVFWTRVVDYSTRPAQAFWNFAFEPHPDSGAYVFLGAVKKAWLQSSPWLAVVLVVVLAAWVGGRRAADPRRRELRAIGLVVWPTLALFSVAGFGRTDGLCFNQRYFMELLPLAAVVLAWTVESWQLRRLPLLLGVLGAGGHRQRGVSAPRAAEGAAGARRAAAGGLGGAVLGRRVLGRSPAAGARAGLTNARSMPDVVGGRASCRRSAGLATGSPGGVEVDRGAGPRAAAEGRGLRLERSAQHGGAAAAGAGPGDPGRGARRRGDRPRAESDPPRSGPSRLHHRQRVPAAGAGRAAARSSGEQHGRPRRAGLRSGSSQRRIPSGYGSAGG